MRFLSFLFLLSVLCSCKKTRHQAAPSCRISDIDVSTGNATAAYHLGYGPDGRLATVHFSDAGSSYDRSFTYSDRLIVVHTGSTGTAIDSVFLHGNGDIDSIRSYNASGNLTRSLFTRNSSGQVTGSTTVFTDNTSTSTSFLYSNGDISAQVYPTDTLTYHYYTDQSERMGDLLFLQQWVSYGAVFQSFNHLFKEFYTPELRQSVVYTFDGDGKISSFTLTGTAGASTTIQTYQLTYNCQ